MSASFPTQPVSSVPVVLLHGVQRSVDDALGIVGAGHFDFETDMCNGPLGSACLSRAPTGRDPRVNAKWLTMAALLLETGGAPEAVAWLEAGHGHYDAVVSGGAIAALP